MVYCRYCGTQNRDGALNCVKCGKPLSLIPNEPPTTRFTQNNNQNFRGDHFRESENINSPIKRRYMNQNPDENQMNQNHNYNEYDQDYGNHQRYQDYSSNLDQNQPNFEYENEPKVSKTAVEWDVVIATALMVIILTAILQRAISSMAIFMSMLIGLAYILVATKSKLSLIKSIPLTILVVLAISAYFSI